jgi:hypothetical protein
MTDYSNDECIKFFMNSNYEEIENNYQEWFIKNRKRIDRVIDRKVNVFLGMNVNNVPCMTYVITIFYILAD